MTAYEIDQQWNALLAEIDSKVGEGDMMADVDECIDLMCHETPEPDPALMFPATVPEFASTHVKATLIEIGGLSYTEEQSSRFRQMCDSFSTMVRQSIPYLCTPQFFIEGWDAVESMEHLLRECDHGRAAYKLREIERVLKEKQLKQMPGYENAISYDMMTIAELFRYNARQKQCAEMNLVNSRKHLKDKLKRFTDRYTFKEPAPKEPKASNK